MRSTFVGRERELSLLGSSLDAAAARQAGVVLVRGETGIGTTRLVGELCRCATGLRLNRVLDIPGTMRIAEAVPA